MVRKRALTGDELVTLYKMMFLIRRFEEKAGEMYARGKITGFSHLYIGEEAVAVGAIAALRERDYVISSYRDHVHCLAKGADPREVMAELFGRATGICKGKGGSMHLFDNKLRFLGGYCDCRRRAADYRWHWDGLAVQSGRRGCGQLFWYRRN